MSNNPYSSPQSGGDRPEATPSRWQPTLLKLLAGIAGIVIVIGLLLPARRGAREGAKRTQCSNNLRQIGLGMQNYLDINGTLPPAYVADADGKPMHSWRVRLLPYMWEDNLYGKYDESQPWDSEANRQLLSQIPRTYQCPSSGYGSEYTSYVVVRGKETIFDADRLCKISSIADGASNTILVVEAPHANIPWTEPRDLDFDQLSMLVNDGPNSLHSDHPRGVNVLFADGTVRILQSTISPQDLRALLTKAGGETISESF